MDIVILFVTTLLQNAGFTLVSRARNTTSLVFHSLAAVLSNGVYLLVLRQVVTHLDSVAMMLTYLIASVSGSVMMHYISMHHLESRLK